MKNKIEGLNANIVVVDEFKKNKKNKEKIK